MRRRKDEKEQQGSSAESFYDILDCTKSERSQKSCKNLSYYWALERLNLCCGSVVKTL